MFLEIFDVIADLSDLDVLAVRDTVLASVCAGE